MTQDSTKGRFELILYQTEDGRPRIECRFEGETLWLTQTEAAKTKAEQEYARYHALIDAQPRAIDAAFEKVAKQLKKPAAPRGKKGKKS